MKSIYYFPEAIRRVAGECNTEAADVDITRKVMMEKMEVNSGPVRQSMDKNIICAQDGMKNTQNLLQQASNFMYKLADYLEEQDQEISQKIRV